MNGERRLSLWVLLPGHKLGGQDGEERTQEHDGGCPCAAIPTLPNVGTLCFLADGVQVERPELACEVLIPLALRPPLPQPGRLLVPL